MAVELVKFMLVVYAMASIIVEQQVFREVRLWLFSCKTTHPKWYMVKLCQLIQCMFCTGVWCGMGLCVAGFNIFGYGVFDFFFSGLLGGASAYFLHRCMLVMDVYLEKLGISDEASSH